MSRATTSSEAMQDGPAAELTAALTSCRGAFLATGLISGMSNVLMLTGAIFMLEIYDRVLPSRSVPTLIGLAVLAAGLYVALGFLDLIRGRILARIGISLDEALSGRFIRPSYDCRRSSGCETTGQRRCETWTPSAHFWAALVRSRYSICLGYRSISESASLSISGSASRRRSERSFWSF